MKGWRTGEIVHYSIHKRHPDQPPATTSQPAQQGSDPSSPSHTPATASPNTRKNRRQVSADISASRQITNKSSGGSLHGDLSAAKHDEALQARETDLEAREKQLRDRQAEHDRRAEAREADLEARETQLRNREAEHDRRTEALQTAEYEVADLRERAQRADELEHLLGGMRDQRTTMLRSITDLRSRLGARETSYQNELMFVSGQTEDINAQIKKHQQTMEGLKKQKDNATARYMQEKGELEAKIDSLQSAIIALFN